MSDIIYRELIKKDYDHIKELIGEAFSINKFIEDKNLLDSVLNLYLQGCILDSSFCKVAEKDGKIIGIILGKSNNDNNSISEFHNYLSFAKSIIKSSITGKENRKLLKEFSKITDCYKDIIKGKESEFQGTIQLFIVSKECRGLGVGKSLMNSLYDYMLSNGVKSMYLYTDSNCNYGFYDSQNFNKIASKKIIFQSFSKSLDVFLYDYNFK